MFTWTNLGPLTLNVTLFLIALAQAFIKQLIRSSNHPIIKFVYLHFNQNDTKYLWINIFLDQGGGGLAAGAKRSKIWKFPGKWDLMSFALVGY